MDSSVEGWGEGIVSEFGIDMYTLLYLKWRDFPGGTVVKNPPARASLLAQWLEI